MTIVGREGVREAIATLFETNLTGAGKPVQVVKSHYVGTFDSAPAIVIMSAGSERIRKTIGIGSTITHVNRLRFDILTFVPSANADLGWTDQNAEDALDEIDELMAEAVEDNASTDDWHHLAFEPGFSTISPVPKLGGNAYLMELKTLIVEV